MYEKAKGVTEDPKKALEFYEQGCTKRDIGGCTGMGFLYSKGLGVPADKVKSGQLFTEASIEAAMDCDRTPIFGG